MKVNESFFRELLDNIQRRLELLELRDRARADIEELTRQTGWDSVGPDWEFRMAAARKILRDSYMETE